MRCTHPDTIYHQVDVPVWGIYFPSLCQEGFKGLNVYLIIACSTLGFSETFAVVQNGSFGTEAAVSQCCAADRSKLRDILLTLKCS